MPVIPEDRAKLYRAAVSTELKTGREFVLSIWDAGHLFRSYEDAPDDIARAIGRKGQYVRERMRLARDYDRAQFLALVDQYGITSRTELFTIAYGHPSQESVTRRSLHLPLHLVNEADMIGLDLPAELKWFLSHVPLSYLRALMTRYRAEVEATEKAQLESGSHAAIEAAPQTVFKSEDD